MDGIVNILKPIGMTSTDVVRWILKKTKADKAGHIGTLDPGAAGVLPVCLGKATRVAEYYTNQHKRYRAEITLGITTDTQDAYGKVLSESKSHVTEAMFTDALSEYIGEIEQIPPMYSAIRKNGKYLYEYARKGIDIDRQKRIISIFALQLIIWQEDVFSKAIFDIECSKGTYIRTLCYDLGQKLGCGAHMSFLVRLGSGPFNLENSKTLEEIEHSLSEGDRGFLVPPEWGLDLPIVKLPFNRLEAFKNGLSTSEELIEVPSDIGGEVVQVFCGQKFLGIGNIKDKNLHPYKVIV